jgi:hypothetical protein
MKLTLNGKQRLTLFQILPDKVGSLQETLLTDAIRNRILTEEFKEQIGWQKQMGQVSFDPASVVSVEDKTFEFSENEAEVIAYGFLFDEQNESVSTDEDYIKIYHAVEEKVQELKSND